MFEKDALANGPGTVVGASVNLNGILKDNNDITIHGHVDGEVISDKNILITETASVKGPVSAEIITVAGKINGAVTAEKKLEITATGKIYGSISTRDLIINSGAHFVGKSAMITDSNQTSKDLEDEMVLEKKKFKPLKKTAMLKDLEEKSENNKYELE